MDCSLSGSSVHGISQARVLEWVAMPSSRASPHPGIKPRSLMSPALADGFFNTSATWDALYWIWVGPKSSDHCPDKEGLAVAKAEMGVTQPQPRETGSSYTLPESSRRNPSC